MATEMAKFRHRRGWEDTLPMMHGHRLSALENIDEAMHRAGFSITAELELAAPAIGWWRRTWRRTGRLLVATFRRLV